MRKQANVKNNPALFLYVLIVKTLFLRHFSLWIPYCSRLALILGLMNAVLISSISHCSVKCSHFKKSFD